MRRNLLQVQLSSHCCQACNHTESDRDSKVRMWPGGCSSGCLKFFSGQNVKATATLERTRRRNCVDVEKLEA